MNGECERVSRDRTNIRDDGQVVDPPTLDEVKKAIRELKNNKAAGKDELPAELLKHGSEQLHQMIHRILERYGRRKNCLLVGWMVSFALFTRKGIDWSAPITEE